MEKLTEEHAQLYRRNIVEGRWVIETHHGEHVWEVVVEPDVVSKLLVVVTAYPVWDDGL
jgi:hypothetical protein